MAVEVIQQCLAWQLRNMGDHANNKDQSTIGLNMRVNAFASQLEPLLQSNKPVVQYQVRAPGTASRAIACLQCTCHHPCAATARAAACS